MCELRDWFGDCESIFQKPHTKDGVFSLAGCTHCVQRYRPVVLCRWVYEGKQKKKEKKEEKKEEKKGCGGQANVMAMDYRLTGNRKVE